MCASLCCLHAARHGERIGKHGVGSPLGMPPDEFVSYTAPFFPFPGGGPQGLVGMVLPWGM